ncbi:MAG: porphobilinogen synthase [Chlamydiales bacterium]|nr:porphobilinogen synthase [Chlamydiales bacterium]
MHFHRPRRNRKNATIRSLVQETRLHASDLIYPLFLLEGVNKKEVISSLPGTYRLSCDLILKEIEEAIKLHITTIALFPIIPAEKKDDVGSEALNPNALLQQAIRAIKREFPQVCLISDIALDPYTSHGHDGILDNNGTILNDKTVAILQKMAVIQAEAGIDMVAPSDMMDGRVLAIRQELDQNGYEYVNIHAYCAKYASAFYGPFRDALVSGLKNGDKKSYQMSPANSREALWEATLDEMEGADILMVKPAVHYLDIISQLRAHSQLPISAYHVSGEYAMLLAAAEKGWLDKKKALWETLISIKRAGADMIFTYAALDAARWFTSAIEQEMVYS